MTDLSIVIVNWNGGDLLLRCLHSIRASRCTASLDVLVVDNHSNDGSREAAAAAFPEFRVIDSGSNLGFGRANNLARDLTDSRVVLFLNPDTELREDALHRAMECLARHPDVGALGCRMVYPDGQVQELGLQWNASPLTVLAELLMAGERSRRLLRRWLPMIEPDRSTVVHKIYGGFLMVRRQVLDAAGWFDDRYFMYAEDADLSRTILALGWNLFYCAEAEIVHVTGGTTARTTGAFSTLMKMESVNKLIAKYQGRRGAVLHRLAVLVGGLVRLGAGILAGLLQSREDSGRLRLEAASVRHKHMVLWSLGLRKPAVPGAPSPAKASGQAS